MIATLDSTKVLPRLSAIASHGMPGARFNPDANKFATQAAVDGVFETQKAAGTEEVDVLMISSGDDVRVMLDETVGIGAVGMEPQTILHACHQHSGTHAFLAVREVEDGGQEMTMNLLNLPLESLGGPLLHVIATNTKRTQNLVSYITQTLRCIQHDYTSGLQFPTRLMNNINEELSEKGEGTLVFALFSLAMTGRFTPTILEWLTDVVKEPNHKRWHQTIDGMYSNLQNHLIINLLPALDRLSIAISALRGHGKFHDGSSTFAVGHQLFSNILEGIDALRLVVKKVQLLVITEQRQFRAFSKWLRVQIDIGTAGPGSKSAVETEEREMPTLDFPQVLAYLKGAMVQSKVAAHILPRPGVSKGSLSKEQFFEHPLVKHMSYDRTAEALKELNDAVDGPLKSPLLKDVEDPAALLNMPALAVTISGHVRVAIDQITRWQSKMLPQAVSRPLRFSKGVTPAGQRATDMSLVARANKSQVSIRTLFVNDGAEAEEQPISVHEVTYTPNNTAVATEHTSNTYRAVELDGRVLDAKFLSPHIFVTLWEVNDAYILTAILCSHRGASPTSTKAAGEPIVIHQMSSDDGFVPQSIVVGGRPGKKVCIVFGNEGKVWKAFDLESGPVTALERVQSFAGKGVMRDEDVEMGV